MIFLTLKIRSEKLGNVESAGANFIIQTADGLKSNFLFHVKIAMVWMATNRINYNFTDFFKKKLKDFASKCNGMKTQQKYKKSIFMCFWVTISVKEKYNFGFSFALQLHYAYRRKDKKKAISLFFPFFKQ